MSMEFKFIGNPRDARDDKGETRVFGIVFPRNVAVKVTDERICKKLLGNAHFVLCDNGRDLHVAPKIILPAADVVASVAAPAPTAPRRRIVKAAVAAE